MQFKKIRVVDSNNTLLDYDILDRYGSNEDLEALRAYVEKFIDLSFEKDYIISLKVLRWVSQQWEHDGLNDAKGMSSLEILKEAHAGKKFRCVEYGKVTADILKSIGILSRMVGLKTSDAAYGGFARGHVASEIWSNELGKWIFVDPQFSIYIQKDNEILNFVELYRLIKADRFELEDIIVNEKIVHRSGVTVEAFKSIYMDFIIKYTGSIDTSIASKRNVSRISLLLDCEREMLTFQGMSGQAFVPTKSIEKFYVQPNKTALSFEFIDEVDILKIIQEKGIKDESSYLENMHHFAANPHFIVKCSHNMPDFSHFEYSHNAQGWHEVENADFKLSLEAGENQIQVRAVNQMALKGMITKVVIEYA